MSEKKQYFTFKRTWFIFLLLFIYDLLKCSRCIRMKENSDHSLLFVELIGVWSES